MTTFATAVAATVLSAPRRVGPWLLGAGLLGSVLAGDEVYFQPADGARLERTVSVALELQVADYELTQAGEPIEPGDLDESLDPDALGGEWLLEFDAEDAFERSRRGRALAFVRTMVDSRLDGESMDDDDEDPRTVRFAWDEDAGDYTRTLVGDDEPDAEDEKMLAGLRVDMDHLHLLPTGAPQADARWDVELGLDGFVATVLPLFETEALLDQMRSSASENDADMGTFIDTLLGELEGAFESVSAEMLFKSFRPDEESGRPLAVFDLEVDESMSMDVGTLLTELVLEQMETEGGGEDGPIPTIELVVTIEMKGEGEFAWDQDGHHLHHMELPLRFELGIDGRFVIELPGLGEFEFVAGTATWDGEMTLTQTATAR